MSSATLSAKVPGELKQLILEIAAYENRGLSSVVRMAVEFYVNSYFELHPQFRADILEARAAMQSGDVEDYEFG